MMRRFVPTIVVLHIKPWPLQMLSQGMAPKWQNMPWTYLTYLRPQANGSGRVNTPAIKISYVAVLDWSALPARTWVSPFPSDLHVGYSHHILTGNGSTNDEIEFSITQQIMHVMFLPLFPKVYSGLPTCWGPFFITNFTLCPGASYGLIWRWPYTDWGGCTKCLSSGASLWLNLRFYPAMGG
jgi:hypothetical protein